MALRIDVIKDELLSDNYFILRNYTYDLYRSDNAPVRQKREVYDRGDGATVLLYNIEKNSVVLIRQFRVATWLNGNKDGRLIESCAGLLDADAPDVCARREIGEETGFEIGALEPLFSLYMSPGGVTERVYFYLARYADSQRKNRGGGIDDEDIEVLELPFKQALSMIDTGEICDGKTVILLQQLQLRQIMAL